MANQDQRLTCIRGDLTLERVDAIVNAAIDRAAGPGLLAECIARYPEGCSTGEARLTSGHELAAQHVIHTVGPIWQDGTRGESEQLAACYRNSLELAVQHGLQTVSFPAISCGVYG